MTRRPIREAYEVGGAIRRHCPLCDASPGQWCVDPRGRIRRVPCVRRGAVEKEPDSSSPEARDYSEPLHQSLGGEYT